MPTALVTGGSRGIGEAVVRSMRAQGLDVYALALDDEDLHRVADETGAHPIGIDVTDTTALTAALEGIGFDVVVNNAGVLPRLESFTEHEASVIDLLIDVNVRAALHVTRIVLPGMVERDHGHLFFLGSIAGRHPTPDSAVYAGTKAALHAFAEGLRCDLLGSSVRVTVLMPGRVETHLYDSALGDHDAAERALYDGFSAIQPEDIAAVIQSAIEMPPNVDLTAIEVVPTKQVFGGSSIARDL